MDSFLNLIKGDTSRMDQAWGQPRLAIVSSVDPATFTVRVLIQPEGVLSGWLPVLSMWIGNGWGLACPPSPGDQVLLICQEGDAEQGIVAGRLWSSVATAPAAPVGEFWIVHRTGSFIKLQNDGSIASSAPSWTHQGDLHVNGNIYDSYGALATLRSDYNEHVHPPSNVPPSPQD